MYTNEERLDVNAVSDYEKETAKDNIWLFGSSDNDASCTDEDRLKAWYCKKTWKHSFIALKIFHIVSFSKWNDH